MSFVCPFCRNDFSGITESCPNCDKSLVGVKISCFNNYDDKIKVYRGTDGDTEPVEMECDVFGHPNMAFYRDIDGFSCSETMYINTHFRTKREAWASIMKSVEARIELAGSNVRRARNLLEEAMLESGSACADFDMAHEKYSEWIGEEK